VGYINKHMSLRHYFVGLAVILSLFLAVLVPVSSAFAQDAPQDPGSAGSTDQAADTGDDGKSCAVEKVGWILCPLIEGAAKMSDWLFKFLADNFLSIQPELFLEDSGTHDAWDIARNLANIMFVIAFIILIYSQVTGGVMSNYGIKRMLPRLIIAAIAVNASYYICQGMVDISNLLGFEINSALRKITSELPQVMGASGGGVADNQTSDGALGKIATGALVVGGFVWLIIALMGGALSMILITCLIIVIVLLMRKALIVLLIVLSPLAFVAYLLPNTEKYFKKWLNMFWQLLLVFPIVSLLMGSGALASGIVLQSSLKGGSQDSQQQQQKCTDSKGKGKIDETGKVDDPCEPTIKLSGKGDQQAPVSLAIAAAVIAVAPLLFVWSVLKGALSAAGSVGGKIATTIEGGAKGAQSRYEKSQFGQYRKHHNEDIGRSVTAGAYAGPRWRLDRRARSNINKRINESKRLGPISDFGGERILAAQALNAKDAKDAAEMIGGDADGMRLWIHSHGDEAKAAAYATANGIDFDGERLGNFRAMVKAGHSHKAGSYMAAANYLASSGKGGTDDIIAAAQEAKKIGGASVKEMGIFEGARSAAGKAGRADVKADLEAMKQKGYSADAISNDSTKNARASLQDTKNAISAIGVAGLHKDMFKSKNPNYAQNSRAFRERLSDPANIAGAVNGAMRGDGEMVASKIQLADGSTASIESVVIAAARDQHGATGARSLQDAANHLENRT
jgi:hypothetical protein